MDRPSPFISHRKLKRKQEIVEQDEDITMMRDQLSRLKRYGEIEIGDIDKLLQTAESQMPYYDSERLYLFELESQQKIWSLILLLSVLMLSLSAILTFH